MYPFFFLSNKVFNHISSASISARVFKFCLHDEDNQVYNCKQNQGAKFYFCLLFLFFPFSISHSKVRIWKFSSKISQKLLKLRVWNLVQTSGMTDCTEYKRISYIWLISTYICFVVVVFNIFPSYQLSIYECYSLPILYTQ